MIWCVEDDASIRDIEIYALKSTGFEARGFEDSASFCEAIRHEKPELIVLDIMLPGTDGIQLLRQLKASPELCDIPVVMATAKGEEYDKIQGLDLGADYYLTKPYNFDEFLAVIQMLLERQKRMEKKIKEKFQSSRQITIGSLRLDLSDGHAYLNNSDTGLTRTEFSLLRLLAENQEKIFSAKELYEAVWGSCAGTDTSTVRRHIFNLRVKIGAEDTDEYDIVSVYGKGYLFTCR